ncbi:MAG TPA: magnesium and cobalt transport protein CorA [Candidatus Limnocylindrales bacterium]
MGDQRGGEDTAPGSGGGRDWTLPWRAMAAKVIGPERGPGRDAHIAASMPAKKIVDCGLYVNGMRRGGRVGYADAFAEARSTPEAFVWLGMHEPSAEQMADVAEVFGLDPLAVEDAVTADARPKVERFGETTFFVLRTTRYVEHSELSETAEVVETGLIMLFVGERFIISVRHGELGPLGPVRADLEKLPQRMAAGPWAVVYAICDRLVESYLRVSTLIEVDVDALEERVFAPLGSSRVAQIYQLKRELMEFKRAVAPLHRPMAALVEDKSVMSKEIRRYMRDASDRLLRVVDRIAAYDDLLNSILQARLAQVTVDQNNDMRKIAAWAAIAATQTAIAGIYGMNFRFMPELETRYGYPAVLTLMLVSAVVLYRMFRRSGWL